MSNFLHGNKPRVLVARFLLKKAMCSMCNQKLLGNVAFLNKLEIYTPVN